MASVLRGLRQIGRSADDSQVVQRAAGDAAEGVARTPERVATAPFRAAENVGTHASTSGRRGLYALGGGVGVGGAGLGAGGALRAREQRQELEAEAGEREDQREALDDILEDEDLSDDARSAALERALDSGLFDTNLGGDPDDTDNVFENIWFRRVLALLAAYYILRTLSSRFSG